MDRRSSGEKRSPGIVAKVRRFGMKRVLLKLSGEALAGEKKTGFDEPTVMKVAFAGVAGLKAGIAEAKKAYKENKNKDN